MASQYGIKRFGHELEAKSYEDSESKYTPHGKKTLQVLNKN